MNTGFDEGNRTKKKYGIFSSKGDMIGTIIVILVFLSLLLSVFLSPNIYLIKTARWTDWNESDRQNVTAAMGEEKTEERFRLYFQYYNVIHEMGHGLMRYNKGVDVSAADEEQLVNDFAVAYWNYYGEPEKMEELYDIVTYAVENIGYNYKNGVDYMEFAKKHSDYSRFHNDFFNFNDYGWFQFSSVKHSIEQNKTLEDVLKEMGFQNFRLTQKKVLKHTVTDEGESTAIINEAVVNFNEWGLYFPESHQSFSNNPNENVSRPSKKIMGIFTFDLF